MSHVIPNVSYRVQTDASNSGIAGILYQIDNEGYHRIISSASRCLKPTESRYTTTELELLAIVYSVTKFREFLIGQNFQIVTDHKALAFLDSTTFANSRLIRMALFIQQFSFTTTHCRGKDNIVADFFSRHPNSKFLEQNQETNMVSSLFNYTLPDDHDSQSS